MTIKLSEILQYKNSHVIQRYEKDYDTNKLDAEMALQEVLKYLWISEKHERDRKKDPDNMELHFDCAVHFEMKEIDDMWHTFILFTREYAEFCQCYFGRFMHHAPNVAQEKPTPEKFSQEFERYLSYVYDHLGEETLQIWFAPLFSERAHFS
jgi:hypothetical protein